MSILKKRTFEDGKAIVAELRQSGLSQKSFAQKLGISVSVVQYWVNRIRQERRKMKGSKVRFLEVVPKQTFEQSSVELPGGIVLKTSTLPSAEYLADLCEHFQRRFSC
jgi:transposase-like protein